MDHFQQEYLDSLTERVSELEQSILSFEGLLDKDVLKTEEMINFKRVIHSIKGSAGSYDLNFAATICHNFEDYILDVEAHKVPKDFIDRLLKYHEILDQYCEKSLGKLDISQTDLEQTLLSINPKSHESSGEKVLIIEPSNMLNTLYRRYLNELGAQVSTCKDGLQALARLLEEPFDAIITGNILRPIDGLSLTRMLSVSSSLNQNIDVYITTSNEIDKSTLPSQVKKVFLKNEELGKSIYAEFKSRQDKAENIFEEKLSKISEGKKALSKIFYVDDDTFIHKIAKAALKKLTKTEVLFFESGKDVLKELESNKPDLIILDYFMPEMDGPEVCRQLRKIEGLGDVPIIFLTAAESEKDKKLLNSLKPLGIITKPIRIQSFSIELFNIWNG